MWTSLWHITYTMKMKHKQTREKKISTETKKWNNNNNENLCDLESDLFRKKSGNHLNESLEHTHIYAKTRERKIPSNEKRPLDFVFTLQLFCTKLISRLCLFVHTINCLIITCDISIHPYIHEFVEVKLVVVFFCSIIYFIFVFVSTSSNDSFAIIYYWRTFCKFIWSNVWTANLIDRLIRLVIVTSKNKWNHMYVCTYGIYQCAALLTLCTFGNYISLSTTRSTFQWTYGYVYICVCVYVRVRVCFFLQ